MSPSQQRSVSVGNITDCDLTQPLCETRVPTHVSCDHLDRRHVSRVPPAPPPRLSSLQRAPSQALMYYTTVPQSLVTRNLGSRHQPTRSAGPEIRPPSCENISIFTFHIQLLCDKIYDEILLSLSILQFEFFVKFKYSCRSKIKS